MTDAEARTAAGKKRRRTLICDGCEKLVKEEDWCYGCEYYVCDGCNKNEMLMGSHDVDDHYEDADVD